MSPSTPSPLVESTLSHEGRVATLTIREPRLNLLSTPVLEALLREGLELKRMDELQLVILTGSGEKAFIGGADIDEMADFDPGKALAFIDKVHQVCHLFRALPVPSIARVNGFCLGAGMEVAACCDLRIGAEESAYGMPEVQLGLPSVVEAAILPSLIGWGRTRELLYTGDVISAADAYRIGFLEKIAPRAEIDAAMQPWVDSILAAESGAIRAQKKLIEGWLDSGLAAGVRAGMDALSEAFATDAPFQRLAAFKKRKG